MWGRRAQAVFQETLPTLFFFQPKRLLNVGFFGRRSRLLNVEAKASGACRSSPTAPAPAPTLSRRFLWEPARAPQQTTNPTTKKARSSEDPKTNNESVNQKNEGVCETPATNKEPDNQKSEKQRGPQNKQQIRQPKKRGRLRDGFEARPRDILCRIPHES